MLGDAPATLRVVSLVCALPGGFVVSLVCARTGGFVGNTKAFTFGQQEYTPSSRCRVG
jgi:hypothetical protein